MRVSRLENDLNSGESWRRQSDGTLVTLSVQETSAEAESDIRRRIFSMQVKLVMSSLKQLKVVKSSISGRVEVELSCSAMMLSTMSRVMP